MMQPMNYLLESKNPLQAFNEGADFARDWKNKDIRDQQTQWQHDDIIEQRDRKAQYEQELQNLDLNDMNAMRGLIARYPELSKGVQTAYDALDAKQKEAALLDTSRLLSLMRAGKASDAVAMLDAQVDAYTNMGDAQKAAEAESMKKLIELSPEAALGTLSMGYAIMAPKDIVDNYKNLSDTYGSQDKLPDEINEIRSNNFDKNASSIKNVAQQISNAAIPQDPATFSLKVGQLYSASLITPEQYQYLMDGVKDAETNPDGVRAFLGNLANQSEAFAIANKPEMKWISTGGETRGVEYDPYTGEVVEKKNYTNTVSPDTVANNQSRESIANQQTAVDWFKAQEKARVDQQNADTNSQNAVTNVYKAETGRFEATKPPVKKPVPASVIKEKNLHLKNLQINAATMKENEKWIKKLESGQLKLGLNANKMNQAALSTGINGLGSNPKDYAEFNAYIKDLANKALRLNAGVQTDMDYKRQLEAIIAGGELPRNNSVALGLLSRIHRDFDNQNRAEYASLREYQREYYGKDLPDYGSSSGAKTNQSTSKGQSIAKQAFGGGR